MDGRARTTRQGRMKGRRRTPASLFWRFSLSVYRVAGVQEECLRLQDSAGIDVNLLLLSAFIGAVHGVLPSEQDLRGAIATVAQWQNGVVGPLRATRRALKQLAPPQGVPPLLVQGLRADVKSIELEAERIEQLALESWCLSRLDSWPRAEPDAAVAANINALLALYGTRSQPIVFLPERLIAAARMAAPRTPAD
jgi:uncharacterized protein (TIGR02444 family)